MGSLMEVTKRTKFRMGIGRSESTQSKTTMNHMTHGSNEGRSL